MRPRKLSDIVIVYRGRCIYGDVVEGQFLPLDRVGPFREMHQLNENCSIIIGSLGYCVAKGASNLREVTHPYATLIKVYSTEAGLLLQYEDRHLELQSVTVSC